jgi:4-amino-4-deoxy-L-arabinose transferase-like glycosyltransferase
MVSGSNWFLRHRSWLIVGAVMLMVFAVRIRLRDMPLERDEGEYAYAGQLMLQGVPPYKEAYNMKLPGTYAAYAVIMAVFGQTPSGIHVGVALVNAASIVLMFLLGRKILDEITGVVAAVFYALLSTSYSILGLQGHATHFVVLPALAGFLLLLKAVRERRLLWYLLCGVLMGLAFLMKQHGVFFGIFGGLFILYCRQNERTILNERRSSGRSAEAPLHVVGENPVGTSSTSSPIRPSAIRGRRESVAVDWRAALIEFFVYSAGFVAPWLLTCLILAAAGVFKQFIFWTVTYAATYVTEQPANMSNDALAVLLSAAVGANLMLWLSPWIGAVMMWWDGRLTRDRRFLLFCFLICSFGSVGVGLFLRQHYFITLLPAMGLLAGLMVSRALRLLKHDRTIELFLALPVLAVFVIGSLACVVGNGEVWFALSPEKAMDQVYNTHLFSTAAKVGEYIRTHSKPDTKIAVLGSEPEIYFLAHRRGATGYVYMYPLMERQAHALKMQKDLINDLQTTKPEYVAYIQDEFSWLRRPGSESALDEWWNTYWNSHYDFATSFTVQNVGSEPIAVEKTSAEAPRPASAIHLFQKKH